MAVPSGSASIEELSYSNLNGPYVGVFREPTQTLEHFQGNQVNFQTSSPLDKDGEDPMRKRTENAVEPSIFIVYGDELSKLQPINSSSIAQPISTSIPDSSIYQTALPALSNKSKMYEIILEAETKPSPQIGQTESTTVIGSGGGSSQPDGFEGDEEIGDAALAGSFQVPEDDNVIQCEEASVDLFGNSLFQSLVKEELTHSQASLLEAVPVVVKRGRGRPRIHPIGYVPPRKERVSWRVSQLQEENINDPNYEVYSGNLIPQSSSGRSLRVRQNSKTYDEDKLEMQSINQRKPSASRKLRPINLSEQSSVAPIIVFDADGNPVEIPPDIESEEPVNDEHRKRNELQQEQRRKYREELKKKSQEIVSDASEESEIDENNFEANSTFLKSFRQNLIGRSSNSKIFELKESQTNAKIGDVVKIIPHKISHHHQSECRELRNEYRFLKKMNHPQIITLGYFKDYVRDRNFCGIILPQAECNLMHLAKTQRHGKAPLEEMRIAFKQIAQAIHYLHENYISHNDIKPDNMFKFSDGDYKLADFGFSIDLPKPGVFKHNSHSLQAIRKQVKIEELKKEWKMRCKQYVAPELIKLLGGKRPRTPSDEKGCDVFALGVSFFIIIFYQLPFSGAALQNDIRYKFFFKGQQDKFWSQFTSIFLKFDQQPNSHTQELKELFNKMLEPNPELRFTIEQVLEHPWFNH